MFYLQVFCQWIIKNNTLTWIQLSIIPSCTLIFLLFTRCNLLLSVFSVSLRVLSNIFSFFLYYHHPLIIYTFAVIHSVLSSHIHTETHAKPLKTSCFNMLERCVFRITPYDQYLPYSYESIMVLVCFVFVVVSSKTII